MHWGNIIFCVVAVIVVARGMYREVKRVYGNHGRCDTEEGQ
jgi:hypothetical protein